ncbi:hypothetical protein QW131_08235 [Roseibium salinum]|nr:hypothetical protein [Roseibium salinum]
MLSLLLDRQITALNAAARAIPQISQAAAALLRAARDGGKIGYAGAGSAGLTALADCLELPGTFGFPRAHAHSLCRRRRKPPASGGNP